MDFSWLLICALLVFCMQAGFLCLESGKETLLTASLVVASSFSVKLNPLIKLVFSYFK